MILFIFGDSIAQGFWDSKGGWADRVKAHVQSEESKHDIADYHGVFNLGVNGNTTKQVLERFNAETQARLWPGEEHAFIFAIGTNDTLHRNNQDFESTPERYSEELNLLLQQAKQHSEKIAFVDLTPVDETLTNPSSDGERYTNERIEKFNEVLHDFCKSNNLPCIRVSERFSNQEQSDLLADGLHPNDTGHELIYEEVLFTVKEWLG